MYVYPLEKAQGAPQVVNNQLGLGPSAVGRRAESWLGTTCLWRPEPRDSVSLRQHAIRILSSVIKRGVHHYVSDETAYVCAVFELQEDWGLKHSLCSAHSDGHPDTELRPLGRKGQFSSTKPKSDEA